MILDHWLTVRAQSRKDYGKTQSESTKRSLVKSISWRILGTLDTVCISWILTGTWELALSIGGIELLTKMVLFFVHERLWNRVSWGRNN